MGLLISGALFDERLCLESTDTALPRKTKNMDLTFSFKLHMFGFIQPFRRRLARQFSERHPIFLIILQRCFSVISRYSSLAD
jgi:cyanate permease